MSTSTGWVQPWDRCSSRVPRASSSAGGVNVPGRPVSRRDPVHPQRPLRLPGARPAQQVPAAVPQHDGPRLDLHLPLALLISGRPQPVHQPQRPRRRARLDQPGRQLRADLGFRSRRGSGRGLTDRPHRPRHPLRKRPNDLGECPAHQVPGVSRVTMSLQHRHDQPHRLGGAEHERGQPQPAPGPVTPVRAADRLDRQLRLPQDRDVTPRGPVRHAEPVAQLLRGNPRVPLDNLQRHQRPRRRAHLMRHVLR